MQPFPKQSHDVRSPALEQVCDSVCGPRTKKFGDPCLRATCRISALYKCMNYYYYYYYTIHLLFKQL